ncbi:WD40 repeat domain-containing protein [Frigoriglobus tundricola]|uniref:Anaphase-promoting complex subunit 4 WD40 domain-containing protein n=1 Tax=Frigoriglobus tundricola TaxID=2774151 RepID=A0A6M5YNZ3_9BACT|nr:hypothetical protein [Frigoriglobus tundricola]QJW95056.1 hypothetical protein FTUN_2582 [Frigoriglobus tundricola]
MTSPAGAAAPAGLVAATTDVALAAAAGQPPGTVAAHLAAGLTGPGTGRAKLYGFVLALAGLGAVGGVVGLGGADADQTGGPVDLAPAGEPRADRLGDALPTGAVARIGTHRFRAGQSRAAEDVAFFPDGRTLASVHGGAEVTLWETATGKPSRVFGGPAGARWVVTSPDGSRLAVAGAAEVWVWAIGADAPRVLWKWRALQFPPQPAVTALAFSPDSSVVAVGDREDKCARLFRAATGEEVGTLAGQPLAMSAAPGGKYLAAIGGRDRAGWGTASSSGTRRPVGPVGCSTPRPGSCSLMSPCRPTGGRSCGPRRGPSA